MTDTALALFYDPECLDHDTGEHPERAARLRAIVATLEQSGVTAEHPLTRPPPATIDQVTLVHNRAYIAEVERRAQRGYGYLDADTLISPATYRTALLAAGSALAATRAVVTGPARHAYSVMRPPGHHALPGDGMGFCLFNNVAIAARDAQRRLGLDRVAIVDIDVHHGNGTEAVFADDPSVLYVSTHQRGWWPGTGAFTETGTGDGRGTTVNLPVPPGTRDNGYCRIFDEVIAPIVARFRPDALFVSAGYDAHWADPLAFMELSISGYARLTHRLVQLAAAVSGGRLVIVLEGGYNLEALAGGVLATVQVLAGQTGWTDPLGPSPSRQPEPDVTDLIQSARALHALT